MTRRLVSLASALFVLSFAPVLRADEDRAMAAYAVGDAAFKSGRYQEAAEAFALADEASPHPVALTSALKAAILADDPVLGMTLVDRAPSRKATPELTTQADRARKLFQTRAGLVSVACQCEPAVNGRLVKPNARAWAAAGPGTIVVGARSFPITVSSSSPLDFVVPAEVAPVEPAGGTESPPPVIVAPIPARPPPQAEALSPAIFGVMTGLTVASGACLAGFGARALSLNSSYLDEGDDAALDPGQTFQTLANVFIAVTAASAVTAVVLIPFTDFGGSARASVGPGSVALTLDLP